MVALPARWLPAQRRKNTVIFLAVRALVGALRALPQPCRLPLATALGVVAWLVAWPQRRLANGQLGRALPQLSPQARRRTVRQMFVHLATAAIELLDVVRLVRRAPLDAASEAVLRQALALRRGVIAVSGHVGNWELLAQAVAHCGLPVTVVAKPLYDPRLTAWLDDERRRLGVEVIWRGSDGSARALLATLRKNRILALLLDQDTRVDGVFVPFFGRPAHTPRAAAVLALRGDVPVVMATTRRAPGGHRYAIERLDVAQIVRDVPAEGRIEALTAAFSQRLESAVRRAPAQWVWLHHRWRQRPEATAACPARATPRAHRVALSLLVVAAAVAAKAGAAPPETPAAAQTVNFRCDGMQVRGNDHAARCEGNVVVREGNTLLCCDHLVGEADAQWQWQRLTCTGAVRVAQSDSAAWARKASFAPASGVLTLEGAPVLQRGQSLLTGERIVLRQTEASAEIVRPRGQMQPANLRQDAPADTNAPQPVPPWRDGPLPATCPLPRAPPP